MLANQNVDAPIVRVEVCGAEAGDRVHYEAAVRQRRYRLAERLNVVPHARRALRRLNEHGAERSTRFEVLLHFGDRNGMAVGRFDDHRFDAVSLGELNPALAEFPRRPDQRAIARRKQIRNRAFHRPRAGTREHDHVVLRIEVVAQMIERLPHQRPEGVGAVVQRHG
jgi:hypothetical protein